MADAPRNFLSGEVVTITIYDFLFFAGGMWFVRVQDINNRWMAVVFPSF